MLIHKDDGNAIKLAMAGSSVYVTLSWNMPNPDNVVDMEYWTSSDDVDDSEDFKASFREAVQVRTIIFPRRF